ncbi:MAG: type II toxin-antitoxin system HicB family antitoxin [Cyanobacteria bacterium J06598_3]
MLFSYKGYTGEVLIDGEVDVLAGQVLNIRDVVTFEGDTVAEVKQAFRDSVDDYLDFCHELGRKANKPFSGKLAYRTTPEQHRQIFMVAKNQGKSVNAWIDEALAAAAKEAAEIVSVD